MLFYLYFINEIMVNVHVLLCYCLHSGIFIKKIGQIGNHKCEHQIGERERCFEKCIVIADMDNKQSYQKVSQRNL